MSEMPKAQQEHWVLGVYWATVIYPFIFSFLFFAGILFYLPSFMLWNGLILNQEETVPRSSRIHLIPYVVWLISWPAFIVAARRMTRWQQIGASIVSVLGITVALFLLLRLSGMTLRIDEL